MDQNETIDNVLVTTVFFRISNNDNTLGIPNNSKPAQMYVDQASFTVLIVVWLRYVIVYNRQIAITHNKIKH